MNEAQFGEVSGSPWDSDHLGAITVTTGARVEIEYAVAGLKSRMSPRSRARAYSKSLTQPQPDPPRKINSHSGSSETEDVGWRSVTNTPGTNARVGDADDLDFRRRC